MVLSLRSRPQWLDQKQASHSANKARTSHSARRGQNSKVSDNSNSGGSSANANASASNSNANSAVEKELLDREKLLQLTRYRVQPDIPIVLSDLRDDQVVALKKLTNSYLDLESTFRKRLRRNFMIGSHDPRFMELHKAYMAQCKALALEVQAEKAQAPVLESSSVATSPDAATDAATATATATTETQASTDEAEAKAKAAAATDSVTATAEVAAVSAETRLREFAQKIPEECREILRAAGFVPEMGEREFKELMCKYTVWVTRDEGLNILKQEFYQGFKTLMPTLKPEYARPQYLEDADKDGEGEEVPQLCFKGLPLTNEGLYFDDEKCELHFGVDKTCTIKLKLHDAAMASRKDPTICCILLGYANDDGTMSYKVRIIKAKLPQPKVKAQPKAATPRGNGAGKGSRARGGAGAGAGSGANAGSANTNNKAKGKSGAAKGGNANSGAKAKGAAAAAAAAGSSAATARNNTRGGKAKLSRGKLMRELKKVSN